MKSFHKIILLLIALSLGMAFGKRPLLNTQVHVSGNCEHCKTRIESAAKLKGVKTSSWNPDKQVLTVTYDSSIVVIEDIEKSVANSGHDTEHFSADSIAYSNLPHCCQYRP